MICFVWSDSRLVEESDGPTYCLLADKLAHGGGEQLGAAHDVRELGVLGWIVADACAARDEDHGRRCVVGPVHAVMTGTAHHPAIGKGELFGRVLEQSDERRVP